MSKLSFSTAKAGLKMTKGLGVVGGFLTVGVAGHEILTGQADTHTWVDLGVTALGVGATVVFGTVALPAVAIGGLAYGVWSFAGGSDWIDENWGYKK